CPIELSPPSVVVRYGESVTVNCTTSETLHTGIGWEATQGGTGLEQVNILPWTVERLTGWDYSPSCYFASDFHEQCVKTLDVVIYKNINIKPSSESDKVLKEGDEIQLLCDIINVAPVQNLTVTWFKGNNVIQRDTFDNRTKIPVDPFSEFTFRATRQDAFPLFRCEADMDLRPGGPKLHVSSPGYSIMVQFCKHKHTSYLENAEVDIGSTVWLKCSSRSNPRPSYSWTYYQTSNVIEKTEDGVSLLIIQNATSHNMGWYTCSASNEIGGFSKPARVTVKGVCIAWHLVIGFVSQHIGHSIIRYILILKYKAIIAIFFYNLHSKHWLCANNL
uniref:Ig-like domain-containing protein n=1 Tax=Gouania willdenowi TaxID=441366 RepID=A0A8C5NBZ7_GOUWI